MAFIMAVNDNNVANVIKNNSKYDYFQQNDVLPFRKYLIRYYLKVQMPNVYKLVKKVTPFKANLLYQGSTRFLRNHYAIYQVHDLEMKASLGVASETHVESCSFCKEVLY
jgi:hypothetical protein